MVGWELLQTEQSHFSGSGSFGISTVCDCWGWDIYVVLWCMIHSLLQKGTGITADWLSFHLISLGFPLHCISLSFPLWSSKITQLPRFGACQGYFRQIKEWSVCEDCSVDVINKTGYMPSTLLQYFSVLIGLIYLQMENFKGNKLKRT